MRQVTKTDILLSLKKSYYIITTLFYLTTFIAIVFVIGYYDLWNFYNLSINTVVIITMTFIYKRQLRFMNGIYMYIANRNVNDVDLNQYGVAVMYSLIFISTYFIPLFLIVVLNTLGVFI